jgi:ABC-type Fe3+ transport system permease subunit
MLNTSQGRRWRRKLGLNKHRRSLLWRMAISAFIGVSVAAVGILLKSFTKNHATLTFESLDNFSTAILTSLLVLRMNSNAIAPQWRKSASLLK